MNLWNKWVGNWLRVGDIKSKAVRGSIALGIGTVFQRAIRMGRIMVLARLLVPGDFGLVAIIMMVMQMLELITDAGVRLSIIQNKDGANLSYLNAAWWFQIVRGIGLFIVSFVFAPYVGIFYDNPTLTDLLRVSSLSILFDGLVSPRVHLLEREFRFGKWTLLFQASAIVGTLVTVVLAYYLRSVWSIVLGTVTERIILCLFSYILLPFRPKLEFHKNSISDLFKFARGMFGLPVLNLIARQGDVFVLGKLVTPAILGGYYLALQLAEQLSSLFSSVVIPVLLPSFSEMKENKLLLKHSLLLVNHGIATLGIPIVVFMAINSSEILSILYGSQYTTVSLVLSILSLSMFIRVQTAVLSQIYFGLSLPHILRRESLKRTVLVAALMYPAARFAGIPGAAFVILLASISMLIFQVYSLKGILCFNLAEFFSKWITGFGLGIIVLMPNILLWIFEVDSLMLKLVLAMGTMTTVIIVGFNNTVKQATL
jgi:O-antigen/teichoic acid export membrane protein